jgi:hypothetical protein
MQSGPVTIGSTVQPVTWSPHPSSWRRNGADRDQPIKCQLQRGHDAERNTLTVQN